MNNQDRLILDKEQLNNLVNSCQEEIRRLKERIEYLERSNNRREDTIMGLRDEIKQQKDYENVLNELEKWLKVNLIDLEKQNASNIYNEGLKRGMIANGRLIQNKLKELKESDK